MFFTFSATPSLNYPNSGLNSHWLFLLNSRTNPQRYFTVVIYNILSLYYLLLVFSVIYLSLAHKPFNFNFPFFSRWLHCTFLHFQFHIFMITFFSTSLVASKHFHILLPFPLASLLPFAVSLPISLSETLENTPTASVVVCLKNTEQMPSYGWTLADFNIRATHLIPVHTWPRINYFLSSDNYESITSTITILHEGRKDIRVAFCHNIYSLCKG